ncbi:MAG: hypothetical protein AAB373_00820 [Patescibacteria group bacterium]
MKDTTNEGSCGVCRWIAPLILAVTSLLLLLLNLGVEMGVFGEWVMQWWPAGLFLYAVSGFCPCKGGCSCSK